MIRLHVYQSAAQGRTLLLSKDITLPINSDETKFSYKKWIPLDLTSTVNKWLQENEQTLSIDIYCESCSKYGLTIVNNHDGDQSDESKNNPALNIVGSVVRTKRKTGHKKHGQLEEAKDYAISQPKKTFCRQDGDKKCCRHKWEIDFRELGGYDYIIQPRNFDAGFCDGSCPYKFNVANNHAFFQSLARHQLKNSNVPNVCCAPTRLADMEVLHIDENDHTRLKVTTMKKMRAMKCSCTWMNEWFTPLDPTYAYVVQVPINLKLLNLLIVININFIHWNIHKTFWKTVLHIITWLNLNLGIIDHERRLRIEVGLGMMNTK